MTRHRHLPRRVRGTRHFLHGPATSIRASTPATRTDFPRGGIRLHLDPSALLAAEALRRRSARPVAVADAGGVSCDATASSSDNCARALKPGGKLAILMGDYNDREAGFVPLIY